MNRGLCFTGTWFLNAFLSRLYLPRIALSASFCGSEVVRVVIKCFRGIQKTHDVIERFLTKLFGGTDIEDAIRKLTPYDYGLSFEAHPRLADVDAKTKVLQIPFARGLGLPKPRSHPLPDGAWGGNQCQNREAIDPASLGIATTSDRSRTLPR